MSPAPPSERDQSVAFDPLPENLLRQPIDFLLADHHRQTKICGYLDRLRDDPESERSESSLKAVLEYLTIDLPRHVADEEDLFASLAANCTPSDEAERLIDRLKAEHASNKVLLAAAEADLSNMATRKPSDAQGMAVSDFADAKRRHIQLENKLLLPLARARLGAKDLRAIGQSMASRRGISFPD